MFGGPPPSAPQPPLPPFAPPTAPPPELSTEGFGLPELKLPQMPSLFGAPPSAAPESPPPEGKQGLGLWGESEFARPPPSSPPPPSGFGLFGPSDFGISDSDTVRTICAEEPESARRSERARPAHVCVRARALSNAR